jgi:hypothetical protein
MRELYGIKDPEPNNFKKPMKRDEEEMKKQEYQTYTSTNNRSISPESENLSHYRKDSRDGMK